MNNTKNFLFYKAEFELDRSKIENFLRNFTSVDVEEDSIHGNRKYMIQMVIFNIYNYVQQKIANRELKLLEILKEDLDYFFQKEADTVLLESIFKNTKRYINLFYEAVDRVIPPKSNIQNPYEEMESIEDVYMTQRLANITNTRDNTSKFLTKETFFPPELFRRQ